MISSINVFFVEPRNQQRLVDLLGRATDEFVGRVPGFISSTLHRSLDGLKVTMSARWSSVKACEAMRGNPVPRPVLEEVLAIAASNRAYRRSAGISCSIRNNCPPWRQAPSARAA